MAILPTSIYHVLSKYEHDGCEVTGVESSHYTLDEACDALRSYFPSQYGGVDYEVGLSDDEEILEQDDPRYFEPSEELYSEADLEGPMRLYIEKKPAPRLPKELRELVQGPSQGTPASRPAPAGAATRTADCVYLLERMVTPSRGDSHPYSTTLRNAVAYFTLQAANIAARQLWQREVQFMKDDISSESGTSAVVLSAGSDVTPFRGKTEVTDAHGVVVEIGVKSLPLLHAVSMKRKADEDADASAGGARRRVGE